LEKSYPNFDDLKKSWPSPFVARTEISRMTGGILQRTTIANLDAKGEGPGGRFRVGRKIAYPVDEIIKFLEQRCKQID